MPGIGTLPNGTLVAIQNYHARPHMPTRPQPTPGAGGGTQRPSQRRPAAPARSRSPFARGSEWIPVMILPQVHLRKPCYDFSFL